MTYVIATLTLAAILAMDARLRKAGSKALKTVRVRARKDRT